MGKKDKKEKKRNRVDAKKKAVQGSSGGGSGLKAIVLPSGIDFWKFPIGTHKIEILDYKVGKHNKWMEEGGTWYERTYYVHRNIGPNRDEYLCPAQILNQPCFLCDEQARLWQAGKTDPVKAALAKQIRAKERQLFAIMDHADPDKFFIWDVAYNLFGELLDARISQATGEDDKFRYFSDREDGMTLQLGVTEDTIGSNKFSRCTIIDFKKRKVEIPKEHYKNMPCLDDLVSEDKIRSSAELQEIFEKGGITPDSDKKKDKKKDKKGKGEKKKGKK